MRNKSSTYLFPLINDILELHHTFFTEFISNTFIFSDKYNKKKYFYILVDYEGEIEDFLKEEDRLSNLDIFIENIDINNKQILLVFEFPKAYLHEYNCYINGQYSKFKLDAKTKIIEFSNKLYGVHTKKVLDYLTTLKHVLFKNKKLKEKIEKELDVTLSDDAELSSIMNENEETIKIDYENKDQKTEPNYQNT